MIKTDKLIIVEGKYDKIKLESIIDALIITTEGFSVFKDKQKTDFIKKYAADKGVIVLTDSDGAGFKIRNYLNSIIPSSQIINLYIPDIYGKEKRKTDFSGEGKIGVEGIPNETLTEILSKYCETEEDEILQNHTSSYDLFVYGINGRENSKQKRKALTKSLGLPERISQKGLLKYINTNLTKEEFLKIMKEVNAYV